MNNTEGKNTLQENGVDATQKKNGSITGAVDHEGHFCPVILHDDDSNKYTAINTDNLFTYIQGTNDALQRAIELYELATDHVTAFDNNGDIDTLPILNRLNQHLRTLLNDYRQATELCGYIFALLNEAIDDAKGNNDRYDIVIDDEVQDDIQEQIKSKHDIPVKEKDIDPKGVLLDGGKKHP